MTDSNLSDCAICGQPATFTDAAPGALPVSYCTTDLPEHQRTLASSGQMPLQGSISKEQLLAQAERLGLTGLTGTKEDILQAIEAKLASFNAPVRDDDTPEARNALVPRLADPSLQQAYVVPTVYAVEETSSSDAPPASALVEQAAQVEGAAEEPKARKK